MDDNHVGDADFLDKKVSLDGRDAEGTLDGKADAGAVRACFDEDTGMWRVDDLDEVCFDTGHGEGFQKAFAGGVIQRRMDFDGALAGAFEGFFYLCC